MDLNKRCAAGDLDATRDKLGSRQRRPAARGAPLAGQDALPPHMGKCVSKQPVAGLNEFGSSPYLAICNEDDIIYINVDTFCRDQHHGFDDHVGIRQ
ncbi:hypothetical protein pipiens_009142 [Culex pipiens pipiens]|uniref:Uncharacterized protein n=1 Tax=Culex pipiens pipiens TaxID=38569 RepID=A0ABD1DEV3_CULPP